MEGRKAWLMDNTEASSISRKPLSLGGNASAPPPAQAATPKQTDSAASAQKSTVAAPASAGTTQTSQPEPVNVAAQALAASNTSPVSGRITGCKTFFTKLHGGAIEFLGDQIASWLEKNPEVHIKQTNVTVGEIQAKKTEPNLIIVVWY
jgi:hypothetical protein